MNFADPSQIPSFSEQSYLEFSAEGELRIAMSPENLGNARLDELGKKWCYINKNSQYLIWTSNGYP